MNRLLMLMVLLSCAGLSGTAARAEPYWIAWEGDDFPENQGWTRVWGNWDGQYEGPGAIRTLEDGVLTYDSMYDRGVYDYSIIYRPGQMDPGPGELFVIEWRLKVDQVEGWLTDPDVGVSSDDAWCLGLGFGYDQIYSIFEDFVAVPFAPGVFHEYRVVSADMRAYDLYIDCELTRRGVFLHGVGPSQITWGEGVQGAASLHHWDYFRFGVVPEPSVGLLLGSTGLAVILRRTQRTWRNTTCV